MRFAISRASTPWSRPATEPPVQAAAFDPEEAKWFVAIPTLDDLIALIRETGHDLIVEESAITIYDGNIE
jgi:hypothetical protein